jgi:hypothetical protein
MHDRQNRSGDRQVPSDESPQDPQLPQQPGFVDRHLGKLVALALLLGLCGVAVRALVA